MHSVGRKKAKWVKVIHCFQYSGRANLKPAEEIGSSMFSFHKTSQHIPVSSAMKWSCFISCWSFDLLCTLTGASTFCKFIELGASWRNSSTITGSSSSLASISNWHVYTSLYFVLCINPDGPPNLDYGAPVWGQQTGPLANINVYYYQHWKGELTILGSAVESVWLTGG